MFVTVVLLWLGLCFIIFHLTSRRPKNFPPGPPALPVLGNILHLSLENPLEDFERLRKTYGNVYSLFIGLRPAVIINGLKAMKEAMVVKATDFAGRPQDTFVNEMTRKKGVILANYGPSWREHRRFALMTLRNFGLGKSSMEERIHAEIQYAIKTLENSTGKTLSPQVMFHNMASNVICQVLFGARYEYDDEFIKVIIQCFNENAKIMNGPWSMLYDSFPKIRNLPLPFKRAFKNLEIIENHVVRLITEHKKTRVPEEPRDFTDCYLDELDKRGDETSFAEDELVTFLVDLHFAGTDTTSNTLQTGFLYLMSFPHIQERCQREIDQVLGRKNRVSFEDRHDMPYMQVLDIIRQIYSCNLTK